MRFGHDILVLHRDHRNIQPDHPAGLTGKIAGRTDDMLTGDLTLVSRHFPAARIAPFNRCHRGIAVYFCAEVTGPARQRLRQISRLDITIIRMPDATDQAIGIAHGPVMFDLIGRQ